MRALESPREALMRSKDSKVAADVAGLATTPMSRERTVLSIRCCPDAPTTKRRGFYD